MHRRESANNEAQGKRNHPLLGSTRKENHMHHHEINIISSQIIAVWVIWTMSGSLGAWTLGNSMEPSANVPFQVPSARTLTFEALGLIGINNCYEWLFPPRNTSILTQKGGPLREFFGQRLF